MLLNGTSAEPKPNVGVQQAMEGFRAFGKLGQVAVFTSLGERGEQRSRVASLERFMAWLPPLMEDRGDEPIAGHSDIGGPDDEVMGTGIIDVSLFVRADALVLVVALLSVFAILRIFVA